MSAKSDLWDALEEIAEDVDELAGKLMELHPKASDDISDDSLIHRIRRLRRKSEGPE